MKIVILVHNLTGGGAERVAAVWATGFAESGHEVHIVLSTKDTKQMTYEISNKVNIIGIELDIHNSFVRRLLYKLGIMHLFYKQKLSQILHEIRPDVCIGVLGDYAFDAYKVSRDLNCKVINTEHNSYERPSYAPMAPDAYKMKFEINRIFDQVTCLTEADLNVENVYKDNLSVLPNPLSFDPVSSVPHKKKIILASGRLDAWHYKGFDILIQAWGRIASNHPDWILQIAGTGQNESKDFLIRTAEENGVGDCVTFLGFCKDIMILYKDSDIFVLSSRYEGFGMVLIEAMSQGCACIACDYKGRQSEIITDSSQGIICPTEDVEALARAIEKMITDESYRKSCQVNAIERAKFYSIDNTMERWHKIFCKIGL